MDFNTEFQKKIKLTDSWLEEYLNRKCDAPPLILEAMRYSVFAGGKRVRPALMIGSYEMFSDKTKYVKPFACAVEMIHTYSLIHDDLPAMDNSDLRRSKPTNHKVFGEANAVLAGDALLNYAFEIMTGNEQKADEKTVLKTIARIAKYSGICGMIGGQVIDIASENKKIDIQTLKTLQEKKTGALIAAAVCGGASAAGADDKDICRLEKYSYLLGLAFQIKDDILDETSSSKELGKPVGNDEKNHKNTYVSLCGFEKAKELLQQYTNEAKEILVSFGEKAEFLLCMTDYLLNRKK